MTDTSETCWVTEVGSRMWGMGNLSSDHDLVYVYRCPTTLILDGYRIPATLQSKVYHDARGWEMDCSFMEIGHLVNLLIKGNVNALWAVMSPLVIEDRTSDRVPDNRRFYGGGWYKALQDITVKNISKSSYHSIKGMAESQFRDAEKRRDQRSPHKSLLTAIRTLRFGTHLLTCGCESERLHIPLDAHTYRSGVRYYLKFDVMDDSVSDYSVSELTGAYYHELEELERVFINSELPVRVNPKPFRKFLRDFRLYDLKRSQAPLGLKVDSVNPVETADGWHILPMPKGATLLCDNVYVDGYLVGVRSRIGPDFMEVVA